MVSENLPTISIVIPTLNAEKVLGKCLESILIQDYPKDQIEIIIADGGSTDNTLSIIRDFQLSTFNFQFKVVNNPLKTGEAGKMIALRQAQGELIALIDSDNIFPSKNWLKQMVKPFSDPEIIGSEPWEFTYRKKDGFIDRYCALLGMNDPLCLFLGNYDKKSVLTGKWTSLSVKEEDKGNWLKITLKSGAIPTIGANGTILRREIFLKASQGNTSDGDPKGLLRGESADYLFDIDIITQLARKEPVKFAKVKIGIIHLFCGSNIGKFIRKQKRRVKDYLYYQKIGVRNYPWQKQNKTKLLKFILYCVTIIPLFYQSIKGYLKKPDSAWFFHPLACWITLLVYGWGTISGLFSPQEMSRKGWRQ